MNILETRELGHRFDEFQVLKDVNLQVAEGERHAIIGPNGAGKTTLFNIITGGYKPSEGKVFFKTADVTKAKPYQLARAGLGRSFQITNTFQQLTAFENIRLAIMSKRGVRYNLCRKLGKFKEINRETNDVLIKIQLDDVRDVPANLLSYGKHRSLEVGLAIAADPDLIMLDEPTAGMSRDETVHAIELIQRLAEGKTVVIVEHDMDVVFSIAERVTVLYQGTILDSDTPDKIRNSQAVKDAYLGETEA